MLFIIYFATLTAILYFILFLFQFLFLFLFLFLGCLAGDRIKEVEKEGEEEEEKEEKILMTNSRIAVADQLSSSQCSSASRLSECLQAKLNALKTIN